MAAASADTVVPVHQPCQRCRSYPGQCDKRVEASAKKYGGMFESYIRVSVHFILKSPRVFCVLNR